ncbi:MAG: hypothetical protein K6G24_14170 [Lachnospiraceae bacterium]|nr:hypothetical protein [Lachnospiraceae bacterium]
MADENNEFPFVNNPPENPAGNSQEQKSKKKHKGLKIALIVILSIIVALGGVCVYAYATQKPYVQNKWAMVTKNDTEYFRWVMDKKIAEIKDRSNTESISVKTVECPEEWSTKGNLNVSLGSEIGSLFLPDNFAGFKDVGIKYDVTHDKNKNTGARIVPFYNNVDIMEIDGAVNSADKKAYVSLPEYRPEAIDVTEAIELFKEKYKESGKDIENIIDIEDLTSKLTALRNSFDEEKIDRLIHITYDKIDEATLQKDADLTVNGLKSKLNVLSCKLEKDACIKIIEEYFDVLAEDLVPFSSSFDYGMLIDGLKKLGLGNLDLNIPGIKLDLTVGLAGATIKESLDLVKNDIIKKAQEGSLTFELSFYVDAKGEIKGGSVKVSFNETKIKVDTLKLVDEENADKAQKGTDVTLNGMKLISILTDIEKKDGKYFKNSTVKPGGMVEALLTGAGSYVLTVKSSVSEWGMNPCDIEFKADLNGASGEMAHIYWDNSFTESASPMPVDTSEANVIGIMDLPDSDYINLGEMLKPLLEKVNKINDENLNTFLENLMRDNLNLGDMSISNLSMLVESGLVNGANKDVKNELRKLLGLPLPYEYASITELPKQADGNFFYSWDIFEGTALPAAEDLKFSVYDYFERPEATEINLEELKKKFLENYSGTSEEREAADDEGIEMGDRVTFDVVPVIGSVAIDSYAYPDEQTTVGNYDYGEGIDDKLVGAKKGDVVDLTLTLDDRFGSFAGYTGTFRITIKKIVKVDGPEWSEKFIVGKLGYESVEALEQELLEKAQAEADEQNRLSGPTEEQIFDALLNKVIEQVDLTSEGNKADAAKNEEGFSSVEAVKTYMNGLKSASQTGLIDFYKAEGYTNETISKLIGIDNSIPDYAVKRKMLTGAFAAKNNITLSQAKYEEYLDRVGTALGYANGAAFYEAMGSKFGQRFLADEFIEQEVLAIVRAIADISWE